MGKIWRNKERRQYMIRANKKLITILAAILCIIVFLGSFYALTASAEEIDDSNPELKLAEINSDVETKYGENEYEQTTLFDQGNGKYSLSSDAFVAWYYNDDIAFAYKEYNVSNKAGDYAEATVTLEEQNSTSLRDPNASIGLMFRSGLEDNAAEVFLHVRDDVILVVYRTDAGGDTLVQYTQKSVKFPVELKMRKEFNTVNLSWKSAGETEWRDFNYPVGMTAKGPLYIGLAAHSCEKGNQISGTFSNFQVKGVGTYTPGEDAGGNAPDKEEYVEEDIPAGENVMLRETFSDGDLTNLPESPTNPVWTEPKDLQIVNQDGNRVWERTFVNQNDWVGNWSGDEWTNDYEVSVDVQFTENCNPDIEAASNTFRLYARHTGVEMYGHSQYAAVVYHGYKISLNKYNFLGDAADKSGPATENGIELIQVNLRDILQDEAYTCLGDGVYHNLKMRVFDNVITVYWDGQEIIQYTDLGDGAHNDRILSVGNVGIGTLQTAVYVDNLLVVRLEDTFGGDYDNQIGGNWSSPIPDYINKWNE